MNALWLVILRILWRLRPVQALEVNLHDVIDMGLAMFADDLDVEDIAQDPAYRATLAAAFFDAHRKLDLLIYLRACEIAGMRPRINSFTPNYTYTHSSTDIFALWRSFHRLVAKFDDYERLAQRRSERLRWEATGIPPSLRNNPLRLDATHRSTSPGFAGGGLRAAALSPPSRFARGRWIGASSRRDGGGCALARGPPLTSLDCLLPTADCLAATCEIAPSRPQHPEIFVTYLPRRCVPSETGLPPSLMTTRANTLRLKKQAIKRLAPARRD